MIAKLFYGVINSHLTFTIKMRYHKHVFSYLFFIGCPHIPSPRGKFLNVIIKQKKLRSVKYESMFKKNNNWMVILNLTYSVVYFLHFWTHRKCWGWNILGHLQIWKELRNLISITKFVWICCGILIFKLLLRLLNIKKFYEFLFFSV